MKTKSDQDASAKGLLSRFWTNESGATAIEYGLIVGLLGSVIILAMVPLGTTISDDVFGTISGALDGASK
ncbi:Flp family type IVb pilin [Roseibium sp. MMSF_3412]|uniref:Flp family type IVb pilin n=1 Tax=Roseibium sp. MMSF_3412 TaxID=3046712 RepID=UPI00273D478E|nr:Flp family type IVb pilin [Roseibium sp. MMSF_3412]